MAASRRKNRLVPRLNAVLVAGERSVADIGGHVIGIGERAFGYRLLAVYEDRAVFDYSGARVVLRLRKE